MIKTKHKHDTTNMTHKLRKTETRDERINMIKRTSALIILTLSILVLIGIVAAGLFSAISGITANYGINATTEPNDASHLLPSTDVPYNSLVGYWSFDKDNSSTAFDFTNNNNDGTYTSGAVSNAGNGTYGNGAYFNGTSSYIDIASLPNFDKSLNYTFNLWINPSSSKAQILIGQMSLSTTDSKGFTFVIPVR